MNSTTISNRKDRNTYGATRVAPLALRLSPMSLRKRLPRSGKKSSSVKSSLLAVARVHSPNFNSARRMGGGREGLEGALPPPNGAQEGVALGDVAAAEWSAGVSHEAVDGAPPKSLFLSLSLLLFFVFYNILVVVVKSNSTAPSTAWPAEHPPRLHQTPPLNPHANRETYSGPQEEICRLPLENDCHFQSIWVNCVYDSPSIKS